MSHKRRRRRRPTGDAPPAAVQSSGSSGIGRAATPLIPPEPAATPRAAPPTKINVPHGLPVSDDEMRRLKEQACLTDEEPPDHAQADKADDTGED